MAVTGVGKYLSPLARSFGAALMFTLLYGCAGGRLYSEARDKQGIAAKAAWEQVDLTKMVNDDRENLKKVLQAQLDTQDKAAAAVRNFTLRAMLQDPTVRAGILARIDDALVKVAGPNPGAAMEASRKAYEANRAAQLIRETHESTFISFGLAVPDCDSIKVQGTAPQAIADFINKAVGFPKAAVIGAVEGLREVCLTPPASVYDGFGGQISAAIGRGRQDKAELEQLKAKSAAMREEYQAAKLAYEQLVKDATKLQAPAASTSAAITPTSAASTSPAVTPTSAAFTCVEPPAAAGEAARKTGEAAERLCKAVVALDKADDAFSVQLLSKERLESLEKFVTAVTQSTGDGKVPEGAGKAATAFILLPKLVDDAHESLAAARMPLAMPLLIRRNIEQLKLEGATREISLLEARVQLSAAITEALYQQGVQLWRASSSLKSSKMAKVLAMPVRTAFSSAGADEKEQLYYATALYLDAINRLDARWRKLEYQRIATFHEISLSYAEVNLKQWSSLIGSAVDQVAESAASGIKTSDVTGLIDSLGILWIGRGVNK